MATVTVDDLLDYIETNVATHTPDASECDCHVCGMHATICSLAAEMVQSR